VAEHGGLAGAGFAGQQADPRGIKQPEEAFPEPGQGAVVPKFAGGSLAQRLVGQSDGSSQPISIKSLIKIIRTVKTLKM